MPPGTERPASPAAAWLLGAALVLPAFAATPSLHHPPALLALKTFVFTAVTFAALLAALPAMRPASLLGHPEVLMATALAVWATARSLLLAPAVRMEGIFGAIPWWAAAAALAAARISVGRRPRTAHGLLVALVLAAAGVGAIFLIQWAGVAVLGRDPLGLTFELTTDLPSATFANRNQLATLLLAGAAGGLGLGWGGKRILWIRIATVVCGIALLATRTEAALLGLAGSVLWVLGRRLSPGLAARACRWGVGALGAACCLAVLSLAAAGPSLAGLLPRAATFVERAALWRIAWRGLWSAPWGGAHASFRHAVLAHQGEVLSDPAYAGVGFLSLHAHDDWLEAGAVLGLPGLLLLAGIFAVVARRRLRSHEPVSGDLLGWEALLVATLLHAFLHYPLHLAPGLACAFVAAGVLSAEGAPATPGSRGSRAAWLIAGPLGLLLAILAAADWRAQASVDRGLELAQAGRIEEAAAQFDRATRLRPSWPAGWSGEGTAAFLQGRPAAAREAFSTALERSPGDPEILANLAAAEAVLGEVEAAEDSYDAALRANPLHVPSLLGRTRLYLREGDREAALRLVERALELEPDNREAMALRDGISRP